MTLLLEIADIFFSSIVVLNPNGRFMGCATVAFVGRYDEELQCSPSYLLQILYQEGFKNMC